MVRRAQAAQPVSTTNLLSNSRYQPVQTTNSTIFNESLVLRRHFFPLLSVAQHHTLMRALRVLVAGLEAANVSYHMCGGTLLGSYLHHGLIPWDDDVDLCVTYKDQHQLFAVLQRLKNGKQDDNTTYSFVIPNNQKRWKFFSLNGTSPIRRRTSYTWLVPFVDICLYGEDEDYIWDLSMGPSEKNVKRFNKSIVYPLGWRPFERMKLQSPRHPITYLSQNYDLESCATNSYSHMRESLIAKIQKKVACSQLWPWYPFVFRTSTFSDSTRTFETLRIGKLLLGRVVVDQWGLM